MGKAFSVASWNVEHFRGKDPARRDRVIRLLSEVGPDVLALYEVEGKTVFTDLTTMLPGYSFHVTEGPQVQEILVGVKSRHTAFFTQRLEFKSGVTVLRPGALLTLKIDGADYSLLFLHTKSGADPRGFGIRDDMLVRATKFQKTLDKAVGGRANYVFLGDLNTMGMAYTYMRSEDVEAANEISRLGKIASRRRMRVLTKPGPSWWNGPGSSLPPSDLDHVVASAHLEFKRFGGFDVRLMGWPEKATDAEKGRWIDDYSDHALLYFEVQKV